jgi:hypothetical protein
MLLDSIIVYIAYLTLVVSSFTTSIAHFFMLVKGNLVVSSFYSLVNFNLTKMHDMGASICRICINNWILV